METLKFLFTTSFYPPYHIGGACLQVKFLSDELAKRGHEVHVMYSLDAYRSKRHSYALRNLQRTAESQGVHLYPIKTVAGSSAYESYIFGKSQQVTREFRDLVRTVSPDIVHHHNVSLLGYEILRRIGDYGNLYTAHDFWLVCQNSALFRNWNSICNVRDGAALAKECVTCALHCHRPPQFWRRTGAISNLADEISCVLVGSKFMQERLLESIEFANVKVLPSFVPNPPLTVANNLPGFSEFFLYAGRLETYKGVMELIETIRKTNTRLVIAGDGPLKDEIVSLLAGEQLTERILFIGRVDRATVFGLMREAQAVIIPSTCAENSPLVAIEALAVGTPIIASNIGGLPEIVEKIDKRLLFQDFDQLGTILKHFNRNEFQSNMIKEIYEENYSPKSYIRRYEDIVNQALS